jgi:hypothetical protein
MGSAMSGIYGPILAVLAFFVLLMQVRLQRQTAQLEHQTTKHMYDQAYIQDARADVDFYLTRLADVLDKPVINGRTPRTILHNEFAYSPIERLTSAELRQFADRVETMVPQLQAIWSAFYSIMAGLGTTGQFPFELQLTSAHQKAVALISFTTCAALDHYLFCKVGNHVRYPYKFSTILPDPQG